MLATIYNLVDTFLATATKPLIVLVGTTASGKTGLSINICQHIGNGAAVVNSDSRQLYKDIHIGTAKITTDEMQGVPHYLLDVLELTQSTSVGWYKREAMRVIDDLHAQQRVPVLVGGSMLYIQAITDNLSLPAKQDPIIRQQLEARAAKEGNAALHADLMRIDPISAQHIPVQNSQHIVRALEVFYTEGKTKTEVLKNAQGQSPYNLLLIGIKRERQDTVQRIEARTQLLLEQGWVQEVEQLLAAGHTPSEPGMQSVGYPDIIKHLQNPELYSLEQARESINKQTRAYAKRQMTWWKRDDRIHWLDCN